MGIRDILVALDSGPASRGRLQIATSLAREQGACLSAVFLYDNRPDDLEPGLTVPRLALMEVGSSAVAELTRTKADVAEQQFRDCLEDLGGKGDWYSLDRSEASTLIALAQASDLVVIGQANPDSGPIPLWCKPEEIVIKCGRPVLMVPYIGSFPRIGQRVLIGWDGSREAARAIHDAIPVICAARAVTLMTVHAHARELDREDVPLHRVVRHLARHQIAARVDKTLRGGNNIADMLLSRAADLSVDMIVVGAYHHSPLREALTGGVSRGLFQSMIVPVLMSH
jgi:nucleotide-binding universal stress UspA family protein